MARYHKYSRMSGEAFWHSLRLHEDSVTLYAQQSYSSALFLAILAKEELGKALILEELLYRTYLTKEWDVKKQQTTMNDLLADHKYKQRWFAGIATDLMRRHGRTFRYPSFLIKEIYSGHTEKQKQDSIYVGLTRNKKGRPDFNGRITTPKQKVKPTRVHSEITLLNDFLIVYAEGYSRNLYSTDSPEIGEEFTQEFVKELEYLWPHKSHGTKQTLKEIRKNPVKENEWGWWKG